MAPDATAQWADRGAAVLLAAFESYRERFSGITACARRHFEQRDWNAAQADSMRRLDVYGECVADALRELGARLRPPAGDPPHPGSTAAAETTARGRPAGRHGGR